MVRFEKVSLKEYINSRMSNNDMDDETFDKLKKKYTGEWENIKLPQRSTSGSAGYDFYAPFDIKIESPWVSEAISNPIRRDWAVFPTGIRFVTDRKDVFLMCVPRSGLGFKNITRLANTCGVIDSDYQYSDNEGHIKVKMTADKDVEVKAGKAIMQGIILPFITTDDDSATEIRNGGFGSTDVSSEVKSV